MYNRECIWCAYNKRLVNGKPIITYLYRFLHFLCLDLYKRNALTYAGKVHVSFTPAHTDDVFLPGVCSILIAILHIRGNPQ